MDERVAFILAELGSHRPMLERSALERLIRLGPRANAAIRRRLRDEREHVRSQAARALATLATRTGARV